MADKHSHLNGAYYGPSIPPPRRDYNRPGRGGGCGFCGCFGCLFKCCCGCIFTLVFQIIITVVIIAGILIFIFWLIFRPNLLKYHVTEASLTQFNYSTTDNMLHYNLALNISARNPNKRIGIYYDSIEANAYYQDQRFMTVGLTPYYQGTKNTTVLSPNFNGQHLLLLGADGASEFNSDQRKGIYNINVRLNLRIRFKILWFKIGHYKPKVECNLNVPMITDGKSSGTFETTKCNYDF